jgi:hypothetical protein
MGFWKHFQFFCQEHKLNPDLSSTYEAYKRDKLGLLWKPRQVPEKTDGDGLSWGEVEALTGGANGTHHTPCPYCGGGASGYSTRFQIRKTLAHAVYHCFYCGISGRSHNNGEVDAGEQQEAERQLATEKREETRAYALRLFNECAPINSNTLGAVYLKARRLELPPNPDAVLRWHEHCPFGKLGKVGCIVALFRNAVTDVPTGIHRTYIYSATDGLSERMALGTMAGSAIKLWPLSGDGLAVGEGIETVLAAVQLGVADPPAWATAVANNLTRVPVIPQVKRLTILADNDSDKSDTGELAARKLRRIWLAARCEIEIKMPTAAGDFNDLLRRRQP